MRREYVCPECGYDGIKATITSSSFDVSIQPGCPACATLRGRIVMLVETTDPRGEGGDE